MWPHRARRGTGCGRQCAVAAVAGRSTESLDSSREVEPVPDSFWSRVGWLILGIAIGAFAMVWLNVLYVELTHARPNMAPQIGYFFTLPFIVLMSFMAGFFEAGFSRYWYAVPGRWNNIAVGASYSSILIALLGPLFGAVFIISNPLVVRWLIKRRIGNAAAV